MAACVEEIFSSNSINAALGIALPLLLWRALLQDHLLLVAGWAIHSRADSGYDSMHSYESSESYSRLASITELCHVGWVASAAKCRLIIVSHV